jgi:hypothetical protein
MPRRYLQLELRFTHRLFRLGLVSASISLNSPAMIR